MNESDKSPKPNSPDRILELEQRVIELEELTSSLLDDNYLMLHILLCNGRKKKVDGTVYDKIEEMGITLETPVFFDEEDILE